MAGRGPVDDKQEYNFIAAANEESPLDDIARVKRELELIKKANPFRMAEMALEIQIEKLRVVEITKARDVALQHLSDAYISVRRKTEIIEQLQKEREVEGLDPISLKTTQPASQSEIDGLKAHIATLESTIEGLRSVNQTNLGLLKSIDPPPSYEAFLPKNITVDAETQTEALSPPCIVEASSSADSSCSVATDIAEGRIKYMPPKTDDPDELVNARNVILFSIPLPLNPPDVTLKAIIIPPPFTLHEFLNGAPGSLRNSLASYRVLYSITTYWCPDREEHGYMYMPVYKCSTNPRIATAHRWNVVDVITRMNKPTECFYNKEGVWYYAGSYKAFSLDNLHPKEWAQLPPETTTAIIKDTISGRKNSSPQNTYETSQLYAAGALKVACVGLQCVGFNQTVYHAIIEHSVKFSQTKWKSLTTASANVLAAAATGNGSSLAKPCTQASPSPTGTVLRSLVPLKSPSMLATPNLSPGLSPRSSIWNSGSPNTPWNDLVAKRPIESMENADTTDTR